MILGRLASIVAQTISRSEAEAELFRQSALGRSFDGKLVAICIFAALCLTCAFYLGDAGAVVRGLGRIGATAAAKFLFTELSSDPQSNLLPIVWWAGTIVIFYLVLPALFVRLALGERLVNYGLTFRGVLEEAPLYVAMAVVMVPVVLLVSYSSGFQAQYPFLRTSGPLFPKILVWEAAYFCQFVGVEFLFRGVLVHGLKHRFGFYSVVVTCIPYCMSHFGKPFPETLGAIITALVLGLLSLRTGSIVPGVLLHYSVAITMDLAALWQKNLL